MAGEAFIRTQDGRDVTNYYRRGAEKALRTAQDSGCRYALLTDKSPSCGLKEIYNGRFSGQLVRGQGVTAALLRRNGIKTFSAEEIDRLEAEIKRDEQGPKPKLD